MAGVRDPLVPDLRLGITNGRQEAANASRSDGQCVVRVRAPDVQHLR